MKTVSKLITLIVSVIAAAACSGNIDPSENGLNISVDKNIIYADGSDIATFTVTYAGEDVSRSKNLNLVIEGYGTSSEQAAGVNTFSTSTPGEYSIYARYKDGDQVVSSAKRISVTAKELESLPSSGYYHKLLAMEFTSVWCTYCPILAEALEKIQWAYPGRTTTIAIHENSMGDDPMSLALNSKIYNKVTTGDGLPLFALDFRKSSQHIVNEYAKIASEIDLQLKNYVPDCGVAIGTSYDAAGRKLEVTAKFKSDKALSCRYHIFLVEDGIQYTQAGHEGSEPYIHDNVLRAIAADNIYGDKLNEGKNLVPGMEYKVQKSFTIPTDWNTSKMRVVASILKTEDGSSYECDNSNVCRLGEEANYLYEKDFKADFERRVCIMEFTGTWCAQCPEGATTLNYLVNKAYKDQAYAMAFHNNDIYALPEEQELNKIFKWSGYPAYVTDMRDCGLLNEGGCSSSIEKSLYDERTFCTASVSCSYNASDATVTVNGSVLSGQEMEYRMAAYVIEDKVIGEQTLGTGEVQKDYTHRHMVRKMLSSAVKGDKLGTLAVSKAGQKTYTFKVEDGWNLQNLSVAVLAIDKDGKVNNMAICAADGGEMGYGKIR